MPTRSTTLRHVKRFGTAAMTLAAAFFSQTPCAAEEPAAQPEKASAEPADKPTGEAPPAPADPPKASDEAARAMARKKAEEIYNAAYELTRKRQWAAAVLKYQASARAYPSWRARIGTAASMQKLQRYDDALEAYESLLRDFGAEVPPGTKAKVLELIDAMHKETGALMVTGAAPEALVMIDGRWRGDHPLSAPVATLAGQHLVRVYKEGFAIYEKDVTIAKGGMETLAVALSPLQNAGRFEVVEVAGKTMEVVVDGVPVGVTPWNGPVSPGPHAVVLRPVTPREDPRGSRCGAPDSQRMTVMPEAQELGTEPVTVVVEPGKTKKVALEAVPLVAVVHVVPNPPTAEVFIDGVSVGRGPYTGLAKPGKHVVELVADGYFKVSEQIESKAGDEAALAPDLPKDLNAPRWARAGRFVVDGRAGVALVPSLGGDLGEKCAGDCRESLGVGMRAELRGGYELPSGIGFGLSAGYFSTEQTRTGLDDFLVVGGVKSGGKINDTTSIEAFALGAYGSYRLGQRFPIRLGLGAGALLGNVTYSRVGIFDNQATGPVTQSGFFPWIYVEAESEVGVRITDGLSVGVTLSGMILVAPRIPQWTEEMPVNAHGAAGEPDRTGTFEGETLMAGALLAMNQGLFVRYGF